VIEFGPAAFLAAFAAGFVSFASPCVLPLVPGYLSFVSGIGVDQLGANPRRVTVTTVWFVAGFGAMFIAFGAGAAWFGDALVANRRPLEIVAGAFIVFAGLIYARAPLPLALLREKRLTRRKAGPVTPALAGIDSRSAGRPASGRRWRRSWRSRPATERRHKAHFYSVSTRSGSGSRSFSSGSRSRARSRSSARSALIGASSASPPGLFSSPSACCSRPVGFSS